MTTSFRSALRRPALACLLWAWYTLLALVVALPFAGWLARLAGTAPETDPLLDGVQLGTLVELLQESGDSLGWIAVTLLAVSGVALLSNAFVNGGVFGVIVRPASGRAAPSFFQAAAAYFLRSLVLLAITAALAVAALAGTAALIGALSWAIGDEASLLVLPVAALPVGLLLLVLDYARVRLVRDELGVARAWSGAAWFLLCHPLRALGPGILYGAAIGITLAVAAWAGTAGGSRTWAVIATVVMVQQALLLLRVLLRVAMVEAESRAVERTLEVAGGQWVSPAAHEAP